MVTLFCVYSDDEDNRCAHCDNWYGVITSRYWILERSSIYFEATIWYTHTPNKSFNILYMSLVRFCRKYNIAPPHGPYTPQWNHSSEDHQSDKLLYFICAVCNLAPFTTHMWGWYGVDLRIFVLRIVRLVPFLTETFTVIIYYTNESLSQLIICRIANFETFGQLVPILCMLIWNNIIPGVCIPIYVLFK